MSTTTSSLSPALQSLSDNGLLKWNLSQADLQKLSPEGLTRLAFSNAKAEETAALLGTTDSPSGDSVGLSPTVAAILSGTTNSETETSQRSPASILQALATNQLNAGNAALTKAKSDNGSGSGSASAGTFVSYVG